MNKLNINIKCFVEGIFYSHYIRAIKWFLVNGKHFLYFFAMWQGNCYVPGFYWILQLFYVLLLLLSGNVFILAVLSVLRFSLKEEEKPVFRNGGIK